MRIASQKCAESSGIFCFSGDIQIGMVDKKGALEVEIIRARGLVGKPGSKALPGNQSSHACHHWRSRSP